MVSEALLVIITTSAITGAFAVAASLLGNRYLHVQEIRHAHHADLRDRVLEPWKQHVRRLRERTGWLGVRELPAAGRRRDDRFVIQGVKPTAVADVVVDFPPRTPLLQRTREHWPVLHRRWETVREESHRIEDGIIRQLEAIESLMGERDSGLSYRWDDVERPGWGRRNAAVQIWQNLLDLLYNEYRSSGPPIRVGAGSEGRRSLHTTYLGEFATADDAVGLAPLHQALLQMAADERWARDLRALVDESATMTRQLDEFLLELERLAYDRNLEGTCVFCPRWFRRKERPPHG